VDESGVSPWQRAQLLRYVIMEIRATHTDFGVVVAGRFL